MGAGPAHLMLTVACRDRSGFSEKACHLVDAYPIDSVGSCSGMFSYSAIRRTAYEANMARALPVALICVAVSLMSDLVKILKDHGRRMLGLFSVHSPLLVVFLKWQA